METNIQQEDNPQQRFRRRGCSCSVLAETGAAGWPGKGTLLEEVLPRPLRSCRVGPPRQLSFRKLFSVFPHKLRRPIGIVANTSPSQYRRSPIPIS